MMSNDKAVAVPNSRMDEGDTSNSAGTRHPQQQQQQQNDDDHHASSEMIMVRIVSAYYTSCEGHFYRHTNNDAQQQQERLINNTTLTTQQSVPYTRDVTPFVRALLIAQQQQGSTSSATAWTHHHRNNHNNKRYRRSTEDAPLDNNVDFASSSSSWVYLNAVVGGQRRVQFFLELDENDDNDTTIMNGVPNHPVSVTATTTTLNHYETTTNNDDTVCCPTATPSSLVGDHHRVDFSISRRTSTRSSMNGLFGDPAPGTSKRLHIHYIIAEPSPVSSSKSMIPIRAESHTVSFAEHERVYLRRRWIRNDDDAAAVQTTTNDADSLRNNQRSGSNHEEEDDDKVHPDDGAIPSPIVLSRNHQWTLGSAESEVVLPLIMPYLEIRERVQCRLVCWIWHDLIREWGVAISVDDNDHVTYPHFSRTFLRGILSHSYASLQCLYLSNTSDLEKQDLHPAIPYLRKLQSLDISRCIQLDDTTLQLLAANVSNTLQVLYLKGLRNVSDTGLIAIARSCRFLRVIDISYISAITDTAAVELGTHLTKLRAIYLRDNYNLTNLGIDAITSHCSSSLEQLTLWGCTRISHLTFTNTTPHDDTTIARSSIGETTSSLVLLNLWGCHRLADDAAHALRGLKHLRTLIASECHRLTDSFVMGIARYVPQLSHLHLRYCKLLTDAAVYQIAQSMPNLYSLDLSFCTKVTIAAITCLLELRGRTLAELRLQACRNLDIARDPYSPSMDIRSSSHNNNGGYAGRQLLAALRLHEDRCCLSVLDVRQCSGQPSLTVGYHERDPFVRDMSALSFEQKLPGYFVRPARWNPSIERHLVDFFLSATA